MCNRSRGWENANQVVTEQLHDEGRVLVALLAEGVELCVADASAKFN